MVTEGAMTKARAICRLLFETAAPFSWRTPSELSSCLAKPGFWTAAQREIYFAEIGRHITTPATLAVARVMIEAVDAASGFCTMPIAEIAKQACCS